MGLELNSIKVYEFVWKCVLLEVLLWPNSKSFGLGLLGWPKGCMGACIQGKVLEEFIWEAYC
jgi:hypothetical protein